MISESALFICEAIKVVRHVYRVGCSCNVSHDPENATNK